jgi:cell division protease FtsH
VHKISIVARGRSLGHTLVLPEEDKYNQTRSEMMDMLAYALGGRAAEEMVFHEPTTGASNDIEKATATARAMVMTYGMSEKLGPLKFGRGEGDVFLGRDLGHERDFSEEVASQIDDEVRMLIERAHDEAWEILVKYRDVLDDMVLKLLDKETLTKSDLAEIFSSVGKRPSRSFSSSRKPPAGRTPVLTPAEIAQLDPKDVPGLGSGSKTRANGSRSNGSKTRANGSRSNGSKTTASSRARTNRTAKQTASGRTARKRTDGGRGRQAPGTTA